MNINNINKNLNFKGLAQFTRKDENGQREIIIKNVESEYIEHVTDKFKVCDTFNSRVQANSKATKFTEEVIYALGFEPKEFGKVQKLNCGKDWFQAIGEKGTLTVSPENSAFTNNVRTLLNIDIYA